MVGDCLMIFVKNECVRGFSPSDRKINKMYNDILDDN